MICVFAFHNNLMLGAESQAAKDHAELELYRMSVAQLTSEIAQLKSSSCALVDASGSTTNPAITQAYGRYETAFFEQETRFRESYLKAASWQVMAANWLLGLVVLLTISGILFSGYQLWTAARIAREQTTSVELEVSKDKIRVQTSVIGVIVLVISGVFLILFLNNVYQINFVSAPATNMRSSAEPSSGGSPSPKTAKAAGEAVKQ